MSLSCACDGDYDWFYENAEDFEPLKTSKRKRCCSCHQLIEKGSLSIRFNRWRTPKNDIEDRIHGSEVYLSPWYMCEKCGDQYYNLNALGFCIELGENMLDLLKEYVEVYKPKRIAA